MGILKTDITLVGGGIVGCVMACSLGQLGINVLCVDQDDPQTMLSPTFDGRTMAISYGSQKILEQIGIWENLAGAACPILDIRVTQNGSPTLFDFLIKDADAPAFGWVIESRLLRRALYERMKDFKNIRHLPRTKVSGLTQDAGAIHTSLENGHVIQSQLVIGADGKKSPSRAAMGIGKRGWDYHQRAIVCAIHHENPHNHVAIEDFRSDGPLAILPMMDDEKGNHRSTLVWTEHSGAKKSVLNWNDETFNAALNERFPAFYGKVKVGGKRFSYPLTLSHAQQYIAPRFALIGDAAHGIHPIAGQGLNLGLRDIAALTDLLNEANIKGKDFGDKDLLEEYQAIRRPDTMMMAGATDALNKIFANDFMPLRVLREASLRLVQKTKKTKKFLMNEAMGRK